MSRGPLRPVGLEQFAPARQSAERGQLRPGGDRIGVQRPTDQHPTEVEQWVADGAHLPVDERRQLRPVPTKQHVAQMRIAMHDSRLAVRRAVGLPATRRALSTASDSGR